MPSLSRGRDSGGKRIRPSFDEHSIGPDHAYICGDEISLADYFGAATLTLGEVIRLACSAYPNAARWLGNVKALPSWRKANAAFYTYFVQPFKDTPFERL